MSKTLNVCSQEFLVWWGKWQETVTLQDGKGQARGDTASFHAGWWGWPTEEWSDPDACRCWHLSRILLRLSLNWEPELTAVFCMILVFF